MELNFTFKVIMTSQQIPLHSGFGPTTTALEVLEGVDLSGKTAVVTGGHSGLGLETTRALVASGASVIVAARNVDQAALALAGLQNVEVASLDLADLASVRRFASDFLATGRHIDMLIASAGIMATPEMRVGPGWEAHFAINHLGHFALTNLLWPALRGGARVVSVSSLGHHASAIRWEDPQFLHGYDKWLAYAQSKTANALFAVHLDRLGRDSDVRAFSLHPGKIFTPLQRHLTQQEMIDAGWMNAEGQGIDPTFKTPEQGAATQVWAATSTQLAGIGGVYCEDCDVAVLERAESPSSSGVRFHAIDPEQAERLWSLSARLTGVNAFE